MDDTPRGAIAQRDKASYAVVPRTPLGLVTPEILERLARVARKYELPVIKITSAQRMALIGMKPEVVEEVWKELGLEVGPAVGLCVHYVQACPGTTWCRFGLQDSLGLGAKLEELFVGRDLPAKAKIGISGCPLNCGESYMRDFGAFGKKSGWTAIFGGNAGGRPRIGDVIAEKLSDDQVIDLAKKCFDYYAAEAEKGAQRQVHRADRPRGI